jgi:hypothetical protein
MAIKSSKKAILPMAVCDSLRSPQEIDSRMVDVRL